jgi:predicted membrane-bound spermidine synthase
MSLGVRRLLFVLFFLSGFCGLVYQVVWTRMAFAAFGIITPVLSVVLSVFMLGLAVGSWLAGTYAEGLVERTGLSPALLYAAVELLIGVGAFAVPKLFAAGERLLLAAGETDSIAYLSLSALVLGTSILPWCICMGATYPLMMAYVREQDPRSEDSFSYLYLANVLGAMAGTLLTAVVLVEVLGFRRTLYVAAAFNLVIASASASLGWRRREAATVVPSQREPDSSAHAAVVNEVPGASLTKWILFSTGLIAMAMEVVWSRAFTQVLRTQVYSFASVVFMYLGATFVGSLLYRRDLRRGRVRSLPGLIAFLAIVAFLPVLVNDPRLVNPSHWTGMANVINRIALLLSICPLCAGLGYLTPHLIDAYGAGNPARAGRVYALNVLGCIVGPLVASYGLLPWISERQALIVLGLPFFVLLVASGQALEARWRFTTGALAAAAAVWALVFSLDFATVAKRAIPETEIRRDHAASVIATGRGDDRQLLVNGIGMTMLTPITKFMVHLPLAFQKTPPRSALIICFGMGTSYRSALSWDLETTAVELVPSVRDTFGYYHADTAAVLRNPKGRIVIDDGRRFLARTRAKYDVIVIDPPPPVEAAGSSLLYSNEFYEVAKQHLNPGGILQAWIPEVEEETARAITLSVTDSFPHVRRFASVVRWGTHLLASMEPIEALTAEQLAARMPEAAKRDLIEWSPSLSVSEYLGTVLAEEKPIAPRGTSRIAITDERPYNEYFLLRTWTSFSE